MSCLISLKELRLVRFVLPSHGRTAVRYRHVLEEALALTRSQCALVAVLILRGPQTIGELRLRTERMTSFAGLDEIEHELRFLSSLEEPLATGLGRAPGQKEERWRCPLVEAVSSDHGSSEPTGPEPDYRADAVEGRESHQLPQPDPQRLDDLGAELAALRSVVGELRRDLDALRMSLGG
jgi:hypothetical protein